MKGMTPQQKVVISKLERAMRKRKTSIEELEANDDALFAAMTDLAERLDALESKAAKKDG